MKTITIQIGNTDDKLAQKQWSEYCRAVQAAVNVHAHQIHFFGGSEFWQQWQNACWVLEIGEVAALSLRDEMTVIRERYGQDSVAWTEGETAFV